MTRKLPLMHARRGFGRLYTLFDLFIHVDTAFAASTAAALSTPAAASTAAATTNAAAASTATDASSSSTDPSSTTASYSSSASASSSASPVTLTLETYHPEDPFTPAYSRTLSLDETGPVLLPKPLVEGNRWVKDEDVEMGVLMKGRV
ncbi:hypothetical protein JCM11251_000800 [Rhodosporidiobolus azoricus]